MELLELVKKSQNGDRQAFAEIYDLLADRIFRYIRLKVKQREYAEDILQEVFIKAWAGLRSLPLKNLNFTAWLYKVAGNTVNDYFRRLYRQPPIVEIDPGIPQSGEAQPDRQAAAISDMETVQKAVKNLPKQYQLVLELRYIQDLSIQETAEILGKSNLAVRLLQHRALKQLRLVMKKYDAMDAAEAI